MSKSHPWGHDDLAADLARKLRNDGKSWTWLNATIGAWSGPRPDIMAFPRYRYDLPQIHAFEIKVSRADMLSDLNSGKWRKYLEHCQSVTFALPHGVATKEDIPAECGVMFRTGRGWRTERRATNLGSPCSIQAMAKLLTCHPAREPYPGLPQYERDEQRRYARAKFMQGCGREISQALARLAVDTAEAKDPVGHAREKAAEILESATKDVERMAAEMAPLMEFLGIKSMRDSWQVKMRVSEVIADMKADQRVAKVEAALARAQKALADVAGLGDAA